MTIPQIYEKTRSDVRIEGKYITPQQFIDVILQTSKLPSKDGLKHSLCSAPAGAGKTVAGLLASAKWARDEEGIALFIAKNRDPVAQLKADLENPEHVLYSERATIKAITNPKEFPNDTTGRVFVINVDALNGCMHKLTWRARMLTEKLPAGKVLKKLLIDDETHLLATESYRGAFTPYLDVLGNFNPDLLIELSATHYNFQGLHEYKFDFSKPELQARNRIAFEVCPIKGKYEAGDLALGAALRAWKDGYKTILIRMNSKVTLRALAKALQKATGLSEDHFYLAFGDVDKRKDIRKTALITNRLNPPIFIFATPVLDQAINILVDCDRAKVIMVATPNGADAWKGVLPSTLYQLSQRFRLARGIDALLIAPNFLLNGNGGNLQSLYKKHEVKAGEEAVARAQDIRENEEAEHAIINAQKNAPKLKAGAFSGSATKAQYTFEDSEGGVLPSKVSIRQQALKELGENMSFETFADFIREFTGAPVLLRKRNDVIEGGGLDTGGVHKEDVRLYLSACNGVNLHERAQEKYYYCNSPQMKAGLSHAFGNAISDYQPEEVATLQPLPIAEATAEHAFMANIGLLAGAGVRVDSFPQLLASSAQGEEKLSDINKRVKDGARALNIAMQFDIKRRAGAHYDWYIKNLRTAAKKQYTAIGGDLNVIIGGWIESRLAQEAERVKYELEEKKLSIQSEIDSATDKNKKRGAKRRLSTLEKKIAAIDPSYVFANRKGLIEQFENEVNRGDVVIHHLIKISEAIARLQLILDNLFYIPSKEARSKNDRKRVKKYRLIASNYAEVLMDRFNLSEEEAMKVAKKAFEERIEQVNETKGEAESDKHTTLSYADYEGEVAPLPDPSKNEGEANPPWEDGEANPLPF